MYKILKKHVVNEHVQEYKRWGLLLTQKMTKDERKKHQRRGEMISIFIAHNLLTTINIITSQTLHK